LQIWTPVNQEIIAKGDGIMSELITVEIPFKKGDIVKFNESGHVANVVNVLDSPGMQAIILDNDKNGNPGMFRLELDAEKIAKSGWEITRIR
jgi:hypothetical protein